MFPPLHSPPVRRLAWTQHANDQNPAATNGLINKQYQLHNTLTLLLGQMEINANTVTGKGVYIAYALVTT